MGAPAVAPTNQVKLLYFCDLSVSLSCPRAAEPKDCLYREPAQISGKYIMLHLVAHSNYDRPLLLSTPSCPKVAGAKYYVITSSANVSANALFMLSCQETALFEPA